MLGQIILLSEISEASFKIEWACLNEKIV